MAWSSGWPDFSAASIVLRSPGGTRLGDWQVWESGTSFFTPSGAIPDLIAAYTNDLSPWSFPVRRSWFDVPTVATSKLFIWSLATDFLVWTWSATLARSLATKLLASSWADSRARSWMARLIAYWLSWESSVARAVWRSLISDLALGSWRPASKCCPNSERESSEGVKRGWKGTRADEGGDSSSRKPCFGPAGHAFRRVPICSMATCNERGFRKIYRELKIYWTIVLDAIVNIDEEAARGEGLWFRNAPWSANILAHYIPFLALREQLH